MTATLDPLALFLRGRYWRRRKLPPELLDARLIPAAISSIEGRWPADDDAAPDDEMPVFIFSAGWGSGSTLLQRLVVSTDNCLVWGEPIDHAAPIQRLAGMLAPVSDRWPRDQSFEFPEADAALADHWIANLTPAIESLRQAHREFLLRWLKSPAAERGYRHWGLKEVRLTIDHAVYLRWLFPNARFLFIYRDVMNSYRSCKGVNWYSVWPHYKMNDPSYFALHWRHLLQGFLRRHHEVGGMLIRYEDLAGGEADLQALEDYLAVGRLNESVLNKKVGSRAGSRPKLSAADRYIIQSTTADLRGKLGYGR